MSSMKFKKGSFITIDDLNGGRIVVLVAKDGTSYWDSINAAETTPLVIHPILNPEELGTVSEFLNQNRLVKVAQKISVLLRAKMDSNNNDSLFLMRMYWFLSKEIKDNTSIDQEMFKAAYSFALKQREYVKQTHKFLEKVNKMNQGDEVNG